MSEENIENIIKSGSNFTPTFFDYDWLPNINFNGHCLKNNIYTTKKSNKYIYIYIYILQTKSMVKKF